ncbi:enoyl-CoA hydratase [Pseudonocardia thermophila]|uniref:Enoyl-CoA hydratase n=1 Tax=Pseudonocardia thermophila TaxID=1848 RepID=A0A1M6XPH8_PSETH|nr:enoyl-CoA hydratase-related protein [Pseudonocardia thermophila]SHL07881.1 enoyl-CoA hydratase [Pseudonocardia thermophila]
MTFDQYRFLAVSVEDDGITTVRMGDPVGPDFVEAEHPMHRELLHVWDDLARAPEVTGVVLTGCGDRFFTGPTLEALRDLVAAHPYGVVRQMEEARGIVSRVLEFDKPLVAAVNGPAVSVACQLAFLSDEVVAVPEARFQDTHIRLGLVAGDGGTWLWPALVGYARARRILLRSHPLSVEDAHELGLVGQIVPRAEVVPRAQEIARKLVRLPDYAYRATKRSLAQWLRLGALLSAEFSATAQTTSYLTPDFHHELAEGLRRATTHHGSHDGARGT